MNSGSTMVGICISQLVTLPKRQRWQLGLTVALALILWQVGHPTERLHNRITVEERSGFGYPIIVEENEVCAHAA